MPKITYIEHDGTEHVVDAEVVAEVNALLGVGDPAADEEPLEE